MKKFYLSIDSRELLVEASLRWARQAKNELKDCCEPVVRDAVEGKIQELEQLAALFKIEENERL